MSDASPMLLDLENCYVVTEEGSIDSNFATGKLQVESEGNGPSVRVILVASQDNKVLVALPFSSWHRTVASRVLEPGSLKKPVALEVAACREDDRATSVEGRVLKIWMGYFVMDYATLVDEYSLVFDSVDYDFSEDGLLPLPASLRELAVEHFAFFSASEGPPAPQPKSGSVDLGSRVSKVEDLLTKMHGDVMKLMGSQNVQAAPSLKRPTSKQRSSRKVEVVLPEEENPGINYPDLDQSVVAAALQAGIDPKTLEEMQKLALKQTSAAPLADPLSESEDGDEKEDDSGFPKGGGDPVHVALSKLTKIVSHLATTKSRKGSKLEQALDGASTTAESSTSTGTKRSAAVRRALRLALTESPAEIYELLERLMQEDVVSHSLEPGLEAASTFTARGWVEHRSHIGAYKAVAHCSWGVAGVLDSLRRGKVAEARARSEETDQEDPPESSFSIHKSTPTVPRWQSAVWPLQRILSTNPKHHGVKRLAPSALQKRTALPG